VYPLQCRESWYGDTVCLFQVYLALRSYRAVRALEIDTCLVRKSLSAVEKHNGSYDHTFNLMKDRNHTSVSVFPSPITLEPVDELS
jgi:hypothetical protein